jgi:hypothetical protein
VIARRSRAGGPRRAALLALTGLGCLLLLAAAVLVAGGAASRQRPGPAAGPGPTRGTVPAVGAPAGDEGYRRGVWLLLDHGEHRNACRSPVRSHYRYIVVQWNVTHDAACSLERIRAANPEARVLAYQNLGGMIAGPHLDGRPSTCVSQEEADEHDAAAPGDSWRLHDPAGRTLSFRDEYAYLQPANLARGSYQERCLRRLEQVRADGYDGVLADDVNTYPGHRLGETGEVSIAEYPSDAAYGDAVVEALRRIGPRVRRLGLLLIPNVGTDLTKPGERARALAVVGASSGLFWEFWTRWSGAGRGQRGATWEAGATLAHAVQRLGKPFLANTYHGPGPGGPGSDQRYAAASFWLVWDGRQDSAWGYDVPGRPEAGFSPAWGPDLGDPLDPERVRVGVGWRRSYTGGTAVVNPSASVEQRFDLGAGHRLPDGSVATTVVLPPATGMVLVAR